MFGTERYSALLEECLGRCEIITCVTWMQAIAALIMYRQELANTTETPPTTTNPMGIQRRAYSDTLVSSSAASSSSSSTPMPLSSLAPSARRALIVDSATSHFWIHRADQLTFKSSPSANAFRRSMIDICATKSALVFVAVTAMPRCTVSDIEALPHHASSACSGNMTGILALPQVLAQLRDHSALRDSMGIQFLRLVSHRVLLASEGSASEHISAVPVDPLFSKSSSAISSSRTRFM